MRRISAAFPWDDGIPGQRAWFMPGNLSERAFWSAVCPWAAGLGSMSLQLVSGDFAFVLIMFHTPVQPLALSRHPSCLQPSVTNGGVHAVTRQPCFRKQNDCFPQKNNRFSPKRDAVAFLHRGNMFTSYTLVGLFCAERCPCSLALV